MASKKPVTCIDIGTDAIKMVTGQQTLDGKINISKILYKSYPSNSFSKYGFDIQVENISTLLSSEKIRDKVYVTLSNPKNPIQILSMPEMPRNEIGEAVKWELTQKKTYDPAKFYFNYIVSQANFETIASNQKIFIHVQAKDEVNKFTNTFATKKVKPQCLEHSNITLVNALQNLGLTPTNKAYMILNMGSAYSYFIVVYNNKFAFERKLAIGGEALTKAVSEYCKLDYENAEKLKKENGIDVTVMSDVIIEAHHILTSSLEKLVSDIQYSMKYFTFQITKSKITTFEKVILTGGTSNLHGIKEFIHERLGIDCTVVDFSEKVILPKGFEMPNKDNPWPIFNTVLGLFFWDENLVTDTCSSLLPISKSAAEMPKTFSAKIVFGLGSYTVIATMLLSLLVYAYLLNSELNKNILQLKREITQLTEDTNKRKENIELEKSQDLLLQNESLTLDNILNTEKSKINAINSYGAKGNPPAKICELVAKAVPQGLFIIEILLDDKILQTTGIAPNNEIIAHFMKELNASGIFKNCNFLYTKKNKDGNYIEFQIKAEKV